MTYRLEIGKFNGKNVLDFTYTDSTIRIVNWISFDGWGEVFQSKVIHKIGTIL